LKDHLKNLILLQTCDNRIKTNQAKRDSIPERIKRLEESFEEKSRIFNSRLEKLDSLEKEKRAVEKEIQVIESRAQKGQEKLNNIKSNKEYTAALKEIEDIEKERIKQEDMLLQVMETIEQLKKECIEIKVEKENLKKEFDAEKKEIEEELLELNEEAEGLMKQRAEYNCAVDSKMLKTYDLLRARRAGVAISAVVGGICQACHLEIPPQKFNELQRCNEMMSCPHCNRLIYWGEDEFFTNLLNSPIV
jgi:predicted  nucleic acid-binding Zn-ribbon protein